MSWYLFWGYELLHFVYLYQIPDYWLPTHDIYCIIILKIILWILWNNKKYDNFLFTPQSPLLFPGLAHHLGMTGDSHHWANTFGRSIAGGYGHNYLHHPTPQFPHLLALQSAEQPLNCSPRGKNINKSWYSSISGIELCSALKLSNLSFPLRDVKL